MSKFVMLKNDVEASKLKSIIFPTALKSESKILLLSESQIYEVKQFSVKYGSWLVDQTIKPENDVLIISQYNPCYCLMTLLDDTLSHNKMLLLSDVITLEGYPGVVLLKEKFTEQVINKICSWKHCDAEFACRLDSEKCLEFLEAKHRDTLECLTEKARETMLFADKTQLSLHAFDIIADYVGPNLCQKLKSHLKIIDRTVADQAALTAKENIQVQTAKKSKLDADGNQEVIEDYTKCGVPLTKLSTGGAKKPAVKTKLKKEVGQKSVSSFFKK